MEGGRVLAGKIRRETEWRCEKKGREAEWEGGWMKKHGRWQGGTQGDKDGGRVDE